MTSKLWLRCVSFYGWLWGCSTRAIAWGTFPLPVGTSKPEVVFFHEIDYIVAPICFVADENKYFLLELYDLTSKWDEVNIFQASSKIIDNANFIFWSQIKQRIGISRLLVNTFAIKWHYRDTIYVWCLTYFINILENCSFFIYSGVYRIF